MPRDGTTLSGDVRIRIAGACDVPMLAMLRALWTPEADHDPDFEERLAAWLMTDGERRTTWLATTEGEPIGMASLFEYRRMPRPRTPDSRWGYVSNMFVVEERRNAGIGMALLDAIIATARERRYVRLVLSPAQRALPFYERAGFVVPDGSNVADTLLVRML
jgi:GNAT superfamily N-acetyltransferase